MNFLTKLIAWLQGNPVISSAAIALLITELQALLLKYKGNAFISWLIKNIIILLNKSKK
jgi:hypothetical protein